MEKADSAAALIAPRLQLRAISKAFPGCLANDSIDLEVARGEIHALLGENGAGKSTLVKIIYGVLKPDSGSIVIDGRTVTIASPAAARRLRVGMVFQHFSLFDALTVADNIALGVESIGRRAMSRQIAAVSERYGLALDLGQRVHRLSAGEKQRIEIVRCLLGEPQLLIMDEPTSVLTPQESDALFATLRQLADEGCSILYISHKLDEVQQLCQRATILRHGKKIAVVDPGDQDTASLAVLMVGTELTKPPRRNHTIEGGELLTVRGLSTVADGALRVRLRAINLVLQRGEILGIAGVAGNGQGELLAALSGEQRSPAEALRLDGTPIGDLGPGARRALGIGIVPEDRLGHATAAAMSLTDNAILTAYRQQALTRCGLLLMRRARHFTQTIINRFDVRGAALSVPAVDLSGGNLQKFIVGREIEQCPRLLIVAQPTWGVDAGAAVAIHQALHQLAAQGAGIIIISQDLDELLLLCHRVGALCSGRLSPLWPVDSVDRQRLGLAMAGVFEQALS